MNNFLVFDEGVSQAQRELETIMLERLAIADSLEALKGFLDQLYGRKTNVKDVNAVLMAFNNKSAKQFLTMQTPEYKKAKETGLFSSNELLINSIDVNPLIPKIEELLKERLNNDLYDASFYWYDSVKGFRAPQITEEEKEEAVSQHRKYVPGKEMLDAYNLGNSFLKLINVANMYFNASYTPARLTEDFGWLAPMVKSQLVMSANGFETFNFSMKEDNPFIFTEDQVA